MSVVSQGILFALHGFEKIAQDSMGKVGEAHYPRFDP
jgi:hypothetical protein